jgi:hypothetical protein
MQKMRKNILDKLRVGSKEIVVYIFPKIKKCEIFAGLSVHFFETTIIIDSSHKRKKISFVSVKRFAALILNRRFEICTVKFLNNLKILLRFFWKTWVSDANLNCSITHWQISAQIWIMGWFLGIRGADFYAILRIFLGSIASE